MKKLLMLITSMLMLSVSYASYNVTLTAGLFYHENGTVVEEALPFALLLDYSGTGFADLSLKDGDYFAAGSSINSSSDYKTVVTGNLSFDDWDEVWLARPTGEYEDAGFVFDNSALGITEGDQLEIALIVWSQTDSDSYVSAGDKYLLFTPSLAGDNVSGGSQWLTKAVNSGTPLYLNMFVNYNDGTLNQSYATLSSTVTAVPEPSTYAVIFGALALGFVVYRRRK